VRGGGGPCRQPWGLGGGRVGGGKEEGCTGNGFPPSISEEGPRREGSHGGGRRSALAGAVAALQGLAVAGARGKGRGRRWDPFPSLTMDWGAAERASHGGQRRRAELARAAALEG